MNIVASILHVPTRMAHLRLTSQGINTNLNLVLILWLMVFSH